MDDLTKRLRQQMTQKEFFAVADALCHEAADRIEADAARLRELEEMVNLFAFCEDAGTRAKLREELHVSCPATRKERANDRS